MIILDHIGVACKSIEEAKVIYALQDYEFASEYTDVNLGIKCCFSFPDHLKPTLELVEDLPGKKVVEPFLKRGIILYHLAYSTFLLKKNIAILKERGYRIVLPPTPSEYFNGANVCFLYKKNFPMIELIEE